MGLKIAKPDRDWQPGLCLFSTSILEDLGNFSANKAPPCLRGSRSFDFAPFSRSAQDDIGLVCCFSLFAIQARSRLEWAAIAGLVKKQVPSTSAQDRLFDCAPFSRSAQDDIRWFVASDSGVLVNEWKPDSRVVR